jgi:hypothetical protein
VANITTTNNITAGGNISGTGVYAGLTTSDYMAMDNIEVAWYSPTNSLRWIIAKTGTENRLSAPASPAAALAAGGTLTVGTAYYYVVTASNAAGETTESAQVTATPTTGNQTIDVTWTAVAGATTYKVYRSTTSASYVSPSLAGNPATNSFADTGVALTTGAPPTINATTNSGSDLEIPCYDDSGTLLGTPVYLQRSTGHVGINKVPAGYSLDVSGDCNVSGAFRINGTPLTPNGLVTSVFTRTGNVVAATGDYTAAQVTNAVSTLGSYADPAWLVSLNWSKIVSPPTFLIDPTSTKGDLIVRGTTTTRLPAGADGQVLTADSTQTLGVRWGSVVSGVSSWGPSGAPRTGAVQPIAGDYTAAQVTNAVDATGAYANPAWITSLPWSKVSGAPAFLVNPLTTKGDLVVYGTGTARLPVGADGQVLSADSTQTLGVRWATNTSSVWMAGTGGIYYSAGNVGIGSVNSATIRLHVAAASSDSVPLAEFFATDPAPSATVHVGCSLDYGSNKEAGWIQAKDTSSGVPVPLILQSQGTTGAGHLAGVGIGQTNPAYTLDVAGDINCTGLFRINGTSMWQPGTGGIYYSGGNVGAGTSTPRGQLEVSTDSITGYRGLISAQYAGANPHAAVLWFIRGRGTGAAPAASVAGDSGMAIISDIVTTDLSIHDVATITTVITSVGTGTVGGDLIFNTNSGFASSAERMRITGAGYVGIGTSSPTNLLTLALNGTNALAITGSSTNSIGLSVQNSSGPASFAMGASGGGPAPAGSFYIWDNTAGVARITISSAGSVGIGTTVPALRTEILSGANAGAPTPGTASGVLALHGDSQAWGLYFGTILNGSCWLQCQRSDANGAVYPLLLNPAGGGVGIGVTTLPSAAPFQVREGVNLNIVFQSYNGIATIQATNDAVSAWVPLQYYASAHYLMGGNVGIGLPNPAYQLDVNTQIHVNNGTQQYSLRIDSSASDPGIAIVNSSAGGRNWQLLSSGAGSGLGAGTFNIYDGSGGQSRMVFQANANVSVPTGSLLVGGAAFASTAGDFGISRNNAPTTGAIYFGNGNSQYIFWDGGKFQLNGGAVKANTTGFTFPDGTTQTTAAGAAYWVAASSGVGIVYGSAVGVNVNTTLYNSVQYSLNIGVGSGSGQGSMLVQGVPYSIGYSGFTTISDRAVKENIRPFTAGLDLVRAMRPIEFEYNGVGLTESVKGQTNIGVIAQELRAVAPYMVAETPERIMEGDIERAVLGTNLNAMPWILVNAICELSARLERLEKLLAEKGIN